MRAWPLEPAVRNRLQVTLDHPLTPFGISATRLQPLTVSSITRGEWAAVIVSSRARAAPPLELLFDLTFVVAFGQAANQLTHALSFQGAPGLS